ncbi:MAG TPA: DUF4129 domain-containing protein [Nocardioides sp.]|nr:DUF4129 domain-containing protein [Nocardioides sp.]
MGAPVRGAVLATVVLLALAAVFAGGSDGLRPLAGIHLTLHHDRPSSTAGRTRQPQAREHTDRQSPPSSHRASGSSHAVGTAFRRLFLLLLALGCAAALAATLRFRLVRRRERHPIRPSPAAPAGGEADLEPEELDAALEQDLTELDEGGSVRNAVVAAWVRLEEHAARAGVVRHPEDTPAEFVARALAAELDPDALAELADLYREARFSRHPIGEAQRDAARDCLARLTRRRTAVTG